MYTTLLLYIGVVVAEQSLSRSWSLFDRQFCPFCLLPNTRKVPSFSWTLEGWNLMEGGLSLYFIDVDCTLLTLQHQSQCVFGFSRTSSRSIHWLMVIRVHAGLISSNFFRIHKLIIKVCWIQSFTRAKHIEETLNIRLNFPLVTQNLVLALVWFAFGVVATSYGILLHSSKCFAQC